MEDALSDTVGNILRDVLSDNPCEPEPTNQFVIASMRKMMQELREMLNNAL
jgi:hypothetical protein